MTIFFKGWQWVVKSLLLLGLAAVTVWLGQQTQSARARHDNLSRALAKLPETLSAEAAQGAVLAQHRAAVERLQRLLPRREEVGAVAGAMEREGTQRNVAVVITDLKEAELRDASGTVAPPSGPVRDLRITGIAIGAPAQLISWLGAVEHFPYLMRIEEWKLRVLESAGAPGTQPRLPDGQVVVPITSPLPKEAAAELAFTWLLSIRHAE